MRRSRQLVALACCTALSACSGTVPATAPPLDAAAARAPVVKAFLSARASSKISHVIVIMQENRSFDNFFHSYPGADTATSGFDHFGHVVPLQPSTQVNPGNPTHTHLQFIVDYDGGKNDGFDRQIYMVKGLIGAPCPWPPAKNDARNDPACWLLQETHAVYSYVPQTQIQPYWTMANQYALADRMFGSNNGPSYPAHQFMISGQSNHVTEIPFSGNQYIWGCGNPLSVSIMLAYGQTTPPHFPKTTGLEEIGPTPCFNYDTAATLLDRAKIKWHYYAPFVGLNYGGVWSAFDAIAPVRRGPDWQNVISPQTRIITDIASGNLPAVSWVVPNLATSDHPSSLGTVGPGPDWVASIVNAVGHSRYWNSTAILILWDEWGGLYDHVVPPQYANAETGAYEGLGYRVPLIVVSPWAKHGYVSHVQHETASTLHFIESVFNLGTLGVADARADDLSDMFDFSQTPPPFQTIPTLYAPRALFEAESGNEAPDDD